MEGLKRKSVACTACLSSLLLSIHVGWPGVALAQTTAATLKQLTLEELMSIQVTSVSRTEERASEAAASVYVITQEAIRRSGVRSLPEALRLAPNLQVAQANARNWAISARGFNAPFANKLLVLIDGRSVYSPLFSGVFWDMQDTMLEDVDRIEVISGPGASVWGANAVNGVINVITKPASQTQGALAALSAGTHDFVQAAIRYGGGASDALKYRVYAKHFDRAASALEDDTDPRNAWYSSQGGFRLEWQHATQSVLTVQGDMYRSHAEQPAAPTVSQSGGNLLARWDHRASDSERITIQAYYDRVHQFVPEDFGDDLDTFDLHAQYELEVGTRHRLVMGAGYRFTHDEVDNIPGGIAFLPPTLEQDLFSAFVQDEISFREDRLNLTIGTKLEHNDYTGLEIQPTVRLAASGTAHTAWAAISRAVRTPSRFDRDLFFPATEPFVFAGGPHFDSETLIAYEIGWRFRAHERVLVSAASFLHDYDDIRSLSDAPPFVSENNVEAEIWGVELATTLEPTTAWRLTAGYTLLQETFRVKPGKADLNLGEGEAFDPQQQFQLRSSLNLPRSFEFDLWLRYVDRISNTGRGFTPVPDYWTLDARIGWTLFDDLELAVVGQNLLNPRHREFGTVPIERAGYGKIAWHF